MEKNLQIIQYIESDEKIFQFTSPSGQMLWPVIRNSVFMIFAYSASLVNRTTPKNSKFLKTVCQIKKILKTLHDLPTAIPLKGETAKVVFFQKKFDLRKYKNKNIDPTFFLASLYCNDSFVFYTGEDASTPDDAPYKSYDILPYVRLINFISKFIISRKYKEVADSMAKYINKKYFEYQGKNLSESQFTELRLLIEMYSRSSGLYYKFYKILWKRIQPRIIFYTVGFYGTDSMNIRAAKDLGILTVEIQHGLIYSNHYAYNFSKYACKHKDFSHNYQDIIFIFGKWFGDKIQSTAKTYITGWPYHTLCRQEKRDNAAKKYIFFLPTGGTLLEFYKLALLYIERHPEAHILLRPHPQDYTLANTLKSKNKEKNIIVSYDNNLYEKLLEAIFVVGDMSTALFTAADYGIPVYSMKNRFTSDFLAEETPFPSFENINDLDEIIKKYSTINKYQFYADNWMERYNNFMLQYFTKQELDEITTRQIFIDYINS